MALSCSYAESVFSGDYLWFILNNSITLNFFRGDCKKLELRYMIKFFLVNYWEKFEPNKDGYSEREQIENTVGYFDKSLNYVTCYKWDIIWLLKSEVYVNHL